MEKHNSSQKTLIHFKNQSFPHDLPEYDVRVYRDQHYENRKMIDRARNILGIDGSKQKDILCTGNVNHWNECARTKRIRQDERLKKKGEKLLIIFTLKKNFRKKNHATLPFSAAAMRWMRGSHTREGAAAGSPNSTSRNSFTLTLEPCKNVRVWATLDSYGFDLNLHLEKFPEPALACNEKKALLQLKQWEQNTDAWNHQTLEQLAVRLNQTSGKKYLKMQRC